MANHIAVVSSKFKSCFINGSPAFVEQEINYGDVIETYNIDIGLQESFKSGVLADSGMLKLFWPKTGQPSGIKSFCKVIYQSSGKWAGPDTVLLDPKSEIVTLDKPKSKKTDTRAVIVKVRLPATLNLKPIKKGDLIKYGDEIRTGENGFVILVYVDDKSMRKIMENASLIIVDPNDPKLRERFTAGPQTHPQQFILMTPSSVASIKG